MLKKTITYEDFNGKEVTEDHFFNLSKADIIELEMSHKGGLSEWLNQIVKTENSSEIIKEFKKLILASYGKKSEDGQRFIKSEAVREEFQSTEAFSSLFVELVTDAYAASEFVNGVVPKGLTEEVEKISKTASINVPKPGVTKVLTKEEVVAMDAEELKTKLATGEVMLG